MNAFYEPLAHAQKKPWVIPPHTLWNVLPIVQLASVPILWENVANGKRYDHVPISPDYPRGGRSKMDWDLGGWSRSYDMASLQTVPCHIAGKLVLSCLKRKLFQTF